MKLKKLHIILCCLIFTSCHWDWRNGNNSAGEGRMEIFRYDKLLNEYVEFNSFSALQKMNTEHLQETKYLIEDVLRLGQINEDHISGRLKAFYSDSTLHLLMKDALEKFDDMEEIEKEFTKGFKNLKKEIPSLRIPRIYAQISALNESVVVGDSVLGFSIDKYLGENYPLYKKYFYEYQSKSMKPDRIVPDCFMFYLVREYPFPWEEGRTLIDFIIHRGKVHYLITKILDYPSYEDELGYTEQEGEWCRRNKKAIWEYMIQNGHLYATDPMILRKYTAPAPYTSFFGNDSPAMIGIWMGIQIIDSYMKNNKEVTLQELMDNTDYRQIFSKSKFKP